MAEQNVEPELQIINPGPLDPSVLTMQNEHIFAYIWRAGKAPVRLNPRTHDLKTPLHDRIKPYLAQMKFYGAAMVPHVPLDVGYISAMVERWRPETHTFHLLHGEMTVTLEDVAILLGLPTDGLPVTGVRTQTSDNDVHELLGFPVEPKTFRGTNISLKWLRKSMEGVIMNENTPESVVVQYDRGFVLNLIGSFLMPTDAGHAVPCHYLHLLRNFEKVGEYAWGPATLAMLYYYLCRASMGGSQLGGCFGLLQLWCWEHLTIERPTIRYKRDAWTKEPTVVQYKVPLRVYWTVQVRSYDGPTHSLDWCRDELDRLEESQIVWCPYTDANLEQRLITRARLPAICFQGESTWYQCLPLINFQRIEQYEPQRVMRQFGRAQDIPALHPYDEFMHTIFAPRYTDFERWGEEYIQIWKNRAVEIPNYPQFDPVYHDHVYMPWYRRISRLYVVRRTSPVMRGPDPIYFPRAAANRGWLAGALEQIKRTSQLWGRASKSVKSALRSCVLDVCRRTLLYQNALDEARRLTDIHTEVRAIMFDDGQTEIVTTRTSDVAGPSTDRGKGVMPPEEGDETEEGHEESQAIITQVEPATTRTSDIAGPSIYHGKGVMPQEEGDETEEGHEEAEEELQAVITQVEPSKQARQIRRRQQPDRYTPEAGRRRRRY